jgi:hypothetical protein
MATTLQVVRRSRVVEHCNRFDFLVLYGLTGLVQLPAVSR